MDFLKYFMAKLRNMRLLEVIQTQIYKYLNSIMDTLIRFIRFLTQDFILIQ